MPDFDFIEDEGIREQVANTFKAGVETEIESLKTSLQEGFDEQIKGLKENNSKLLDEKKKIQQKFEGITDPEEALAAMKLLNENEDMKLFKEGKFDEVVEKRVSGMKSEHEDIVNDLNARLKEKDTGYLEFKGKYESKMIDDSIREAALKANVRTEAIEDILNKGRMLFTLGQDGLSVEARDSKGKLLKTQDDVILTTSVWVDQLKTQSPHYWPPSKGGDYNPDFSTMDDLDREIAQAAREGDNPRYRLLRDKKKEATGKK